MTNLQMLLISKINWVSMLLQELWLAGLWNCGVSFTCQTVVKQWQKCVLARQSTTTTTSSVCKTYILSWFLDSCLSWTTCYYWWEHKVLKIRAASTNIPLYTVTRSWPPWKEVIGVPGSLVKGPMSAVTSTPRGTVKYVYLLSQFSGWESISWSNRETLIFPSWIHHC